MNMYEKLIRKREENNLRLEENADQMLVRDDSPIRIENEMDDVQSAMLCILERMGLSAGRLYGFLTISDLLDTMLDPLGIMYEYSEDISVSAKTCASYILAFREDGAAVALMPGFPGCRYYCPRDSSKGYASDRYLSKLQKKGYIFARPFLLKDSVLGSFVWNTLSCLTGRDVSGLVIAAFLITALGLVIPSVSRWVYKSYITGLSPAFSGLLTAALIYGIAIVAKSAITLVKSLILMNTRLRVSVEMESAVMSQILCLPHSYFSGTSSGKISKRVNSCCRLTTIILDVFMDVLLNLAFSTAYLVQMRSFASELFLPALAFIALRILLSFMSALYSIRNEIRLLDLDMEYTGFLFSSIKGIQKLKGLGCESFIYSRWAEMYRKRLSLTYQQPFLLKYSTELLMALTILSTISLLGVSIWNGLSAEDYLTFTASFSLIMSVVYSLTDIMENMLQIGFLCRNVAPVFKEKKEETDTLEYIHRLRGDIRAEDICFSYEDESRMVLKGVSIDIHKGEKVAIAGESGCGKSTLLKILLGMERPLAGAVFYDGKALQSFNLKSLRRCIGSVFQFSRLFPGTIAENIAFGHEEGMDEEQIWKAADMAEIGDYIRSLPLKMETSISESNSSGFSGGQRQRLLLARAILNRPRILFLDEATSALDNLTQTRVLENIGKMNATVVMVAHRLSTVEHFDRIIMLENGRIAEEGSYSELMEKNGKFADLVRKQLQPVQKEQGI